ncbi:type II toxin-antitoxin system MqsA family antitoxin [Ferrimicrobium sp.]|uniref:type II toxin-antitoxin system MqsA family antitoxin n=1 Tax=Ferrimicrobium sp. TaxID=2926050 RepID=UPI002632C30B|nr:type II toxin-antitoxin system MqsA family antitoxin [Ferrimicrobium sp.]
MKCAICKSGKLEEGVTAVTVERGGTLVVFRRVPARICPNCGESYLEAAVVDAVCQAGDEAASAGVEVDVREFHHVSA